MPISDSERAAAFAATGPVREAHRFDEAALERHLAASVAGFAGPMEVRQFLGGQSNPSYLLSTPAKLYVLRKKPPGKLLPSAHLVEREVKAIIIACNTVSAVAPERLRVELDLPVLGVIEPGARAAAAATKVFKVGVLATAGTIASGAYPRAIAACATRIETHAHAAPLLVPLAEEGWTDGDVPTLAARRYLEPLGIRVAYTWVGVVVALTVIGLPFVVRTVQPALEDLEAELEEAAASLGAGRIDTIRRVILPAILPALLTGFAMAFARAVGEYGSVIFIAGNMPMRTEIAPLMIKIKLEQYDYTGATAIAVVMLVLSFALLLVISGLQAWTAKRTGRDR